MVELVSNHFLEEIDRRPISTFFSSQNEKINSPRGADSLCHSLPWSQADVLRFISPDCVLLKTRSGKMASGHIGLL